MAIALLHLTTLLAPLHQLAGWFVGHAPAASRPLRPQPAALAVRPQRASRPLHAGRVVRVVRVVEASRPAAAGRMVISGRMADVCAELDRLAESEARH